MNTSQAIFKADDRKSESVTVEEWGVSLVIWEMSARQRAEYEDKIRALGDREKSSDLLTSMCTMIASCCFDEKGQKVFSDEDIPRLEEKSMSAVQGLFVKCMELNKMARSDIEELEKN